MEPCLYTPKVRKSTLGVFFRAKRKERYKNDKEYSSEKFF